MLKKRKIWKLFAKISVILYIVLFCTPAFLYVLVRTPFIQQFIVDKTTDYLSEKLNTDVEIGSVTFDFFLDVNIQDLKINDDRDSLLASIDELVVGFENLSLKKRIIYFKKAEIINPVFHLKKYEGEKDNNMQFIIDFFAEEEKEPSDSEPWNLHFRYVSIKNGEFSFHDYNKEYIPVPQIDFNHIHLEKVEFIATKVKIEETISAAIRNLTFQEQSGFLIKHFKADFAFAENFLNAQNMVLLSKGSKLDADIIISFEHTRDFNDFVNKIQLNTDFRKSRIDFHDIFAFSSDVPQLSTEVFIEGSINGTISNLSAKNLNIEAGRMTNISMNCMLMGLPDINETFFDFSINNLSTTSGELIMLATDFGVSRDALNQISSLAQFNINGSFIGFLNSFYTDFNLNSNLGDISGQLSMKTPQGGIPSYNGSLTTNRFNIGQLINNEMFGILTSDLKVNGFGLNPNTMKLEAFGVMSEFEFNNYVYNNITIKSDIDNGLFDGYFTVADNNVFLNFNGIVRFSDSIPSYNFIASVEDAYLNPLNFNRNDSLAYLSGIFEFNGSGNSIDNFFGNISASDISYDEGKSSYNIHKLIVSQDSLRDGKKRISLRSDIADGYIEGLFTLSLFGDLVNSFMSDYITHQEIEDKTTDNLTDITFGFEIKDFSFISGLFIPELKVSRHTNFTGSFRSGENVLFSNILSSDIEYDGIVFHQSIIGIETFSKNIYLSLQSEKISYSDSIFIENFVGNSVIAKNNINFSTFWNNYDTISNTSGYLQGTVSFPDTNQISIAIAPSHFTIQNNEWEIPKGGSIRFIENMLLVNNLNIVREEQTVSIHGIASPYFHDQLDVKFENFDIDNLHSVFAQYGYNLSGRLSGSLHLKNVMDSPYFTSDLILRNFFIDNKNWGNLTVKSTYNNLDKSVYADIGVLFSSNSDSHVPLSLKGFYHIDKKGNELDFVCSLSSFKMELLEPFLQGEITFNGGTCQGIINITGDVNNPQTNGSITLNRVLPNVAYLKTSYIINNQVITINTGRIYANNLKISTITGQKTANADVLITHNNFSDINLDITLTTDGDFLFMNTGSMDNEDFYGTVYADGFVHVTGSPDNITMKVTAKTGRGTQFYLPMDAAGYVSESNFVTFVDTRITDIDETVVQTGDDLKFRMILDLEVTPDAEMLIIFDPKIGDIMRGKATGNLKIDYDMGGDFTMFGNLDLVEGDYLFTLENVINKKFFVSPGSKIQFEGDPYNALIDIKTYYPTRARLFDLVSHIDSSDVYRKKIPVNVELDLKNNLMTPDITFNITLPQSDENSRNMLNTAISSDQELNRQVFSLLIINSFVQPEASFSAPLAQGVGTTSFEFISNQFSNWLSQISKDFDIGINYRPGTELTTEEVEVMFSSQFLNDRIRVEGNVGVGGNQIGNNASSNQQILGDVLIENKITPDGRISLKTFNRSNTVDAIIQNAPYTQGVGIFFRKDFDSFNDLLKRKNKSKAKKTKKKDKNQDE